jgi:hypothetical protein
MIINPLKIKSEAILLFCRDIIENYKDTKNTLFSVDPKVEQYVEQQIDQLYKAINVTCQPIDYYVRNKQVSRIQYIIRSYDYIGKHISKKLDNNTPFNPSMLCFALLCSWFAELSVSQDDKEFLFFSVYPYSEFYDSLLLHSTNPEYKALNISMLQIAEETIEKLHSFRFHK